MKKGLLFLLCAALLLCAGGCKSYPELYERMVIHGVGVDLGEEGYDVTVRCSSAAEDKEESLYHGQGETVLEALNGISLTTGMEPFYSHNYLVVFGEECARWGLEDSLDFFVRYYNTRPAVSMFLARGEASAVLEAKSEEVLIPMSQLQNLGKSGAYNGKVLEADVLEFVNGIRREGSSSYLPVLEVGDEGVSIGGTALFSGYRLRGFLTLEETRGLLLCRSHMESGEVVVETEELGAVTLTVSTKPGAISVGIDGGNQPFFQIKIQAEGDVSSISTGKSRESGEDILKIEKALSQKLREDVENALNRSLGEAGCDVFGLGNLLYQKYPNYWAGISRDWKALMGKCSVQVQVQAKVLRLEEEEITGGRKAWP